MTKYIVDFKQDATQEQIDQFLSQRGLTVDSLFDKLGKVYLVTGQDPALLTGANDPLQSPVVEKFVNDSDNELSLLEVVYEVPKQTYPDASFTINDPKNWWKSYSCNSIDFDQETKTIPRKGQHTSVYVLDSGIVDGHSEFAGVNIVKLYSITGEFNDANGHGTAIASVISGRTCGLTDATIKVVKLFDPNVPLYQSSLLSALNAIVNDYLQNQGKPAVVNISWSIPKNEYVESKIQTLINMGIPVVCSAGNNGIPIENTTPASMTSVLTIGAYNQDFEPCDFSNYQASEIAVTNGANNYGELDGWAPGIDIWAAKVDGTHGFTAGTSMAAAIASATIAYNITPAVDDNGNLYPLAQEEIVDITRFKNYSLNGRPLLILDPNKYLETSNKIVMFAAEPRYTILPAGTMVFQKGKNNSVRLLRNHAAKTIKFDSLPAGLTLENGWIVGNPTVDLEGKEGKTINVMFEITFDDNSVHQLDVMMVILSETYDVNNIPQDDPLLNYTLEGPVCSGMSCDWQACGQMGCYNMSSKGVQCWCNF